MILFDRLVQDTLSDGYLQMKLCVDRTICFGSFAIKCSILPQSFSSVGKPINVV